MDTSGKHSHAGPDRHRKTYSNRRWESEFTLTFFGENYIMNEVINEKDKLKVLMEAGEIPVQVRYCESQIHGIFRRYEG